MTATPRWLVAAETALIVLAPYVYWQMPHDFGSDGYFRLEATRYLANGQLFETPYSLVMSIVALPLYHFGDIVARFNMFVLFGGLAVAAAVAGRRIPADILRRSVLIILAASMFGHHTQSFFGEVLTAMCVTVGLAFVVAGAAAPGFAVMIVGVVNAPATIPAMFLLALDRARAPFRLVRAAVPVVLAAALVMLEFYIRRGNPFDSGYGDDHGPVSVMPYSGRSGFSYPFAFGVLSILFSFGKGLALFTPGLWLLFKRPVIHVPDALRKFQRHAVWFVAGLVLTYAKWWAWPGGWFWGPRFFLFASVPASIALAVHLSDRDASVKAKALTLGLLAWSVWVGISGGVYGQNEMGLCNVEPNFEPLCWYSIEFSALFRPFIVPKALTAGEQIAFGYSVLSGIVLATPFAADLLRAARLKVQRA